jgi:DNA-binding XRE family transcriptional regulator
VARKLGLTPDRVARVLQKHGVARRPAGPALFVHGLTQADQQQLAARLRATRLAAGFTQDDLSERSGITQVTISALETGRQCPTRRTLLGLAQALQVPVKELLPPGHETSGSPGETKRRNGD